MVKWLNEPPEMEGQQKGKYYKEKSVLKGRSYFKGEWYLEYNRESED